MSNESRDIVYKSPPPNYFSPPIKTDFRKCHSRINRASLNRLKLEQFHVVCCPTRNWILRILCVVLLTKWSVLILLKPGKEMKKIVLEWISFRWQIVSDVLHLFDVMLPNNAQRANYKSCWCSSESIRRSPTHPNPTLFSFPIAIVSKSICFLNCQSIYQKQQTKI